MLTQLRDRLSTTWRQVYALTLARLPGMSADEQARLSWAKPIQSYAAVPDVFKPFFEGYQAEGRAFPYTILTPSYQGFLHRSPEKLVCDLGQEIAILERSGEAYQALRYPLDQISYLEVRTVLLDSRIQITGVTSEGEPASSSLRFNSVTDYLFIPILETIRLAAVGDQGPVESAELKKFDGWVRLNFKFMNYAKRSLLGGEKVIQAILQPEIRAGEMTILGRTYYPTLAPALAAILTDGELIVIQEVARLRGDDRYGGIWHYMPLHKIAALSLSEKDRSLLELSVQLPQDVHLEFLFHASAKGDIDQLLRNFHELTN